MLTLKLISSLAELRASAPAWDDLWRRSDAGWPTLHAEAIAMWADQFADARGFRALAVQDGDTLLAALPMVRQHVGRVLPIDALPGNAWSPAGDLLLDEACDVAPVLDLLVQGLAKHGRPLLWCDAVSAEAPRWRAFLAALDRAGLVHQAKVRGEVGCVDLRSNWDAYFAARSRNMRRQMRVAEKRALQSGAVELRLVTSPTSDELPELLRRGFAVEDRSWKGSTGSSVLRSPVIFEYFLRQARQLAHSGTLMLAFLDVAENTIAFEYGWIAKGTYYSLKVGYDERYAELSPGQLLRTKMIERFYATGQARMIDFLGPITEATAKWTTRSYEVSRLLVATNLTGRMMLAARGALQKWRGKSRTEIDQPSLGEVAERDEEHAETVVQHS